MDRHGIWASLGAAFLVFLCLSLLLGPALGIVITAYLAVWVLALTFVADPTGRKWAVRGFVVLGLVITVSAVIKSLPESRK